MVVAPVTVHMGRRMFPATKFHPPAVMPRSIRRDDLLALLRGRRPAVVTVQAPAGYGKSTLVAQLLAQSPAQRIWVSIDDDDNDPAGLWAAVGAAAAGTGLTGAAPELPSGGDVRSAGIVPVINAVARSAHDWILVLDDAHQLSREDVVACLDWFLGRLPENLTVVIATRAPLDLPALGRLRARGALVEFSASMLCMEPTHIEQLLRMSYALDATETEIGQIVNVTGGWPAAVSLVGSAMAHRQPLARVLSQRPDDEAAEPVNLNEARFGAYY